MPAPTLPMVIEATENALRALLGQELSRTQIAGYREWLYLNLRLSAPAPADVLGSLARILKEPLSAVTGLEQQLKAQGMLLEDGSLSTQAQNELQRGRELVRDITAHLLETFSSSELAFAIDVLTRLKQRAEQALHR
jgi:hypothetical protein